MKALLLLTSLLASAVAGFAQISYTDWTTATLGNPGSAAGVITLPDFSTVNVSYSGNVSANTQTAGGINYWVPNTPFISATVPNTPTTTDIITINQATTYLNTVTFATPVLNPVMLIVSLGQSNVPVSYDFNTDFQILSFGPGFWGGPGTLTETAGFVLNGLEGHGTIQILGTVSSFSWTVNNPENWHGFTIGLPSTLQPVPEPSTWLTAACFTGLVGVIALRRRSKKA